MDADAIIHALKRLGITHEEIGETLGRDRTVATKMLAGSRNVHIREIAPLMELIAKHERLRGEAIEPDRVEYVEVEVLPTYAGMGGGGSGDGDRRKALISARLVRDELRARASDLLLVPVRGDSMEPDFRNGDEILIDRRSRDTSQPGAFALWDDDGYVVKLVERLPARRGWLRIFSANPRYSDYEIEEKEATIMGRPVWFARRL